MRLLNVLLMCGLVGIAVAADNCGECMTSNEALCVNETYYKLCANGSPITAATQCRSGQVCTNSENICEVNPDGKKVRNVCTDDNSLGSCGTCSAPSNLICVSSTQYSRCGADLKQIGLIACPEGQLCSEDFYNGQPENKKQMCAPELVLEFFEYDVTCPNSEITTTTTTTVAPSTEDLVEQCLEYYAANYHTITKKYFYTRNNNDCKTYVYCEFINSEMEAILFVCKSGLYYDSKKAKCVADQPSECQSVTSTSSAPSTTTAPGDNSATDSNTRTGGTSSPGTSAGPIVQLNLPTHV